MHAAAAEFPGRPATVGNLHGSCGITPVVTDTLEEPMTGLMETATAVELDGLVGHVIELVSAAGLDADATDLRDALAARRAGAATVVVVGETKRGKSSLINALLERPGLLPVDAGVATSTYIEVLAGKKATATVISDEHANGLRIRLDDVYDYAALDGSRTDGVRGVRITEPNALLEQGLAFVDTPGVGGLEDGHTDVTLAALSLADALLFVVDSEAELTEPELRFLRRAAERIDTVIFALTKTDVCHGWRTIAERDRDLVARHAPRFASCPWFPVSSRVALEGTKLGDPAAAAELRDESGVGALALHLTEQVAERADVVRATNVYRTAASSLARLRCSEQVLLKSAAGDPQLRRAFGEEQRRLGEFQSTTAKWRQDLAEEFQKLTIELQQQLGHRLAEVLATSEANLTQDRADVLEAVAIDLEPRTRAVWTDVNRGLETGAADIVARLAASFAVDGSEPLLAEVALPEFSPTFTAPTTTEAHPDVLGTVSDYLPAVTSGYMLSNMVPNMLHGVGLMGGAVGLAALNPVGLSIGLAAGVLLNQRRRREQAKLRTQQEARMFVRSSIERARSDISAALQLRTVDVRRAVDDAFGDRLAHRKQELDRLIGECQRRLQADQVEAKQLQAATAQRLHDVDCLGEAIERAAGSLRAR